MKTATQALKASPNGASASGRTMMMRLVKLVTIREAAKKVRPCEIRQAKTSAIMVIRYRKLRKGRRASVKRKVMPPQVTSSPRSTGRLARVMTMLGGVIQMSRPRASIKATATAMASVAKRRSA